MKKSILTKIILMVFLCLFSIFFRETKIAFAASSLSSLTNPSLTDIFVINESSSINLHTAIVSKNGDYLCLWDNRTLNNGMDIFGQFFSLDGTPQGSILNFTPFIMDQDAPAIDSDTNSFLMVWEDRRGAINPDPIKNTGWDIYGALINLKGEIIKEIVIDSSTGDQKLPRVKYNGRHYLVVWEDWQNHDIKTSNVRLYGMRLDTNGEIIDQTPLEIEIDSSFNKVGMKPCFDIASIQYINYKTWFIAWNGILETSGSENASGIVGRFLYEDTNSFWFSDTLYIKVPTNYTGLYNPSVESLGNEFLVVWESWIDNQGTDRDIWGIRLNLYGNIISDPISICSESKKQTLPELANNGKGYFVTWLDERESQAQKLIKHVYGKSISREGVPFHNPLNPDEAISGSIKISADDIQIPLIPVVGGSRSGDARFFCLWSETHYTENRILINNVLGRLYSPVYSISLDWVGTADFMTDGVLPDFAPGGSQFVFKVRCIFSEGIEQFLEASQVWIDIDDNNIYGAEEKFDMTPEGNPNTLDKSFVFICKMDKILYNGDGYIDYSFFFKDKYNIAIGDPVFNNQFQVYKNGEQPVLNWTNEPGYTGDGAKPDGMEWNEETAFEFRVVYKDADGEQPENAEVWVDKNMNSIFEPDEKWDMEAGGGLYQQGVIFSKKINISQDTIGPVIYKFKFDDGYNSASGDPSFGSYISFNPVGETSVCLNHNNQFFPSITYTANGVQLFWEDHDNSTSTSHIQMAMLSRYGKVEEEPGKKGQIRLDKSNIGGFKPAALFDPDIRKTLVIWEDLRDGSLSENTAGANLFKPESRFTGLDIYGLFIDSNGEPLLNTNGSNIFGEFVIAGSETQKNMLNADMALGYDGQYLVVWEDETKIEGLEMTNISARFVKYPGGAIGEKIDLRTKTWGGIGEGHQLIPRISWNGEFYMIVWQDIRSVDIDKGYYQSRINGIRIDPNAEVYPKGLGFQFTNIADPNINQIFPDIASDGENFLIVWQDSRSLKTKNGYDIYGMRINSNGNYLMPLEIPICTAEGHQIKPEAFWDSQAGQFLITWLEVESSLSPPDMLSNHKGPGSIRVARMDPNGILFEGESDKTDKYPGTRVAGVSGTQDNYDMCCDPNLGCRMIWEDTRNSFSYDIYTANLQSTLNWTQDPNYSKGVMPHKAPTGSTFKFQVEYRDRMDNLPETAQVWIDINDNLIFEEDEKFDMALHIDPNKPLTLSQGRIYIFSKEISFPEDSKSDGIILYRFYFINEGNLVKGIGAGPNYLAIEGAFLQWSGLPGFETDGVEENNANSGSTFTFTVVYKDISGILPVTYEILIDQDDNGNYGIFEIYQMGESDISDKDVTDGKEYTFSIPLFHHGNGTINYRFYFHNGAIEATGEPVLDHNFQIIKTQLDDLWNSYKMDKGLGGNHAIPLAIDQNNVLWAGFLLRNLDTEPEGGLSRFDGRVWETFKGEQYLPSDNVTSLTISYDNHLWIGTSRGISCFDGQKWEKYTGFSSHNYINTIVSDINGRIWAGIYPEQDANTYEILGGGLLRYESGIWTHYGREILGGNIITSLAIDINGQLWIGILDNYMDEANRLHKEYKGISIFDPETEEVVKHFNTSEGNFPGGDWITAMCSDYFGNMWAGSIDVSNENEKGAGLFHYNSAEKIWTHYHNTGEDLLLASNVITFIYRRGGDLLIGHHPDDYGPGGATYYSFLDNTWQILDYRNVPHGRAFNYINSIIMDAEDKVWLGTVDGIVKYENPREHQQTIPLFKGWNLISFQIAKCIYDNNPPGLFLIDSDKVVYEEKENLTLWLINNQDSPLRDISYPGRAGDWQRILSFDEDGAHLLDKDVPSFVNNLHYLSAGYGWWIKMNNPSVFIIQGEFIDDSFSLNLIEGWNLAGFTSHKAFYSNITEKQKDICPYQKGIYLSEHLDYCPLDSMVEKIFESITDKYIAINIFDFCFGAMIYHVELPGFVNTVNYMGPKYGFWIKMKEPDQFSFKNNLTCF